jgi:hypothetical protein
VTVVDVFLNVAPSPSGVARREVFPISKAGGVQREGGFPTLKNGTQYSNN